MAAYIGPELLLEKLLVAPSYGLMEQSWAPREMREGKLNADGYGFGWYNPKGDPARYTNPMPIWSDPNLSSLAHTLQAPLWIANVRSATRCMDVSHANTQPFLGRGLQFLHNGYVKDFAHTLRRAICHHINADIEAGVEGNTDSEYLFALLLHTQEYNGHPLLEQSIRLIMQTLDSMLGNTRALLNFVITNGDYLVATRHAVNGECPSLYINTDDEHYPDASLIASEPLNDSAHWQAVPEHHLVVLKQNTAPHITPL
ncbi:MAG: ergothioneine biosynthesis protein EgtC [Gammaproteobacteria bacterium]|nr:MAG: ergothioneine biosynthesis protein EgtC [Gammaproteobacteria bacterium]